MTARKPAEKGKEEKEATDKQQSSVGAKNNHLRLI
jgi:hypothetical protein